MTDGDDLHVTARQGSDAWRLTSYGFIHSSEHALLTRFEPESAIEVQFRLDFAEQFDQAGIFVKVDDETWVKAGVELSDGQESLGAVVTRGTSDWSLSPVPGWAGRLVTVRGSWSGNALTVRARVDEETLAARPRRTTRRGHARRGRPVLLRADPGRAHRPLHVMADHPAGPRAAPERLSSGTSARAARRARVRERACQRSRSPGCSVSAAWCSR